MGVTKQRVWGKKFWGRGNLGLVRQKDWGEDDELEIGEVARPVQKQIGGDKIEEVPPCSKTMDREHTPLKPGM